MNVFAVSLSGLSITIGTPFNAQADHTNAGWLFRLLSGSTSSWDPVLGRRLRTLLQPEDWVLVKGSRGMRMETIIEQLKIRL